MIHRFINDTHIGSTEATHTFEEVVNEIHRSSFPVILLGDVVDLKNCPKDKVDEHLKMSMFLHATATISISGNHDPVMGIPSKMIGGNWLEHGDYAFWGREKANAFRTKPNGAGWFKRQIFIHLLDDARCLLDPGPNRLFRQYCSFIKTFGATRIIVGHRHPKETLEGEIDGVRFTILKRGINDIDLT